MTSTVVFNELLNGSKQGDAKKTALLFPIVYTELKKIAHNQMRNAWSLPTMQTTALINETYLKLLGQDMENCADRQHFFAICAKAMRQVLINFTEQKHALKRGGSQQPITYVEVLHQSESQNAYSLDTLLAVDQALVQLEEIDKTLSELVELRFFAGLTEPEIAELSGISERTVRRNWTKAKALLAHTLSDT